MINLNDPRVGNLYTAIISDVLDEMGIYDRVLPPIIRPLYPDVKIVGEAVTAFVRKYDKVTRKDFIEWSRVMLDFLMSGGPNKVYVISSSAPDVATWGEMMTRTAIVRGAVGAITDGALRDVPRILPLGKRFQIYYASITPLDAKPRLEYVAYNIPISIHGVTIKPGDIVFGDYDGVVVIPREVATEVINRALERLKSETALGEEIMKGEDVRQLIRKYGEF
jgi:regulator of RNase E activity RraA